MGNEINVRNVKSWRPSWNYKMLNDPVTVLKQRWKKYRLYSRMIYPLDKHIAKVTGETFEFLKHYNEIPFHR